MKVKDIIKEVWRNLNPVACADIRKVIPVQVDPLRATLCHDDCLNVDSDISLILNERRITDAGVLDELKKRFSAPNQSSDPFEGMSDKEIFENTVNWRCQSLSEKKAYIDYVAARYGRTINSLKDTLKVEVNKDEENKDNSNSSSESA